MIVAKQYKHSISGKNGSKLGLPGVHDENVQVLSKPISKNS